MLDCSVDTSKHVKPLANAPKEEIKTPTKKSSDGVSQAEIDKITNAYPGKLRSLSKYSWYEASNGKWIKAIITIPDTDLKSLDSSKIQVKFGLRTVDILVKDAGASKNQIFHFGCRRTQKPIVAGESKWSIKGDGIQVSLKKEKKEDGWMSFYKEKVGDVDSEFEDDVIRQIKK